MAGGELALGRGPAAQPAATIDTDPETLGDVLTGQRGLAEAQRAGDVRIEGSTQALSTFPALGSDAHAGGGRLSYERAAAFDHSALWSALAAW